MTFGLFWDETGILHTCLRAHTMLGLEKPVFLLELAQWEGRMGVGVALLGLSSPSHHLSEHYLAKLAISSTRGAFPAPAANLLFQAMLALPCPTLTYLSSSSIWCLLTTLWQTAAIHHRCQQITYQRRRIGQD